MKYKDLVFFLTQLSTYIKSGIPLTDSIVMLDEQTKNKNRKNLYKKILYELNTGAPLVKHWLDKEIYFLNYLLI